MGNRRNPGEQLAAGAEPRNQRELFNALHPRVHGFFRSRGFPEDEALDLTQEALIRVFQNMGRLRSPSSLDSWVMRIAANIWKNELRHRKARKRDAQEVSLGSDGANDEAVELAALASKDVPSPLDEALSSERLAAVDKCLDALPPRMRRCLVLYAHQERKYQEIADLLDLSIQSVKSHIHQARERLEECVARRLAGGVR